MIKKLNFFTFLYVLLQVFFIFSVSQITTTTPTYSSVPEFQTGSYSLISSLTTSSDPVQSYQFSFSPAYTTVPKVVYGSKQYASDDGVNPYQQFYITNQALTAGNLNLSITLGVSTNIHLFDLAFLAMDSSFAYHVNFFEAIPINFSNPLTNITFDSVNAQYFEQTIDYNAQSVGQGYTYTSFSSISSGKVIPLITSIQFQNFLAPALFQFQLTTSIISINSYKLRVDISQKTAILKLKLCLIILDSDQIKTSGTFMSVTGFKQKNNHNDQTFLLQAFSLSNSLAMSFTYWKASRCDCALIYSWTSSSVNGTLEIAMQNPTPPAGYTAPCSFVQVHSNYFYMKKLNCPPSHPYVNITAQLCQNGCYNGYYPDIGLGYCVSCVTPCSTCTTVIDCLSCVSGLFRFLNGTSCDCVAGYYQDALATPLCATCSSTITDCSSCFYDFGILGVSCTACTNGMGLDSTSNTCVVCSSYNRDLSSGVCTTCTSGFYQDSLGNFLCQICSSAITDCSTCFYNPSIPGVQCTSCTNGQGLDVSTNTCIDCSIYNRIAISGVCVCQDGYYQDQFQNPLCILCSSQLSNCINCIYTTRLKCNLCDPGFVVEPNCQNSCDPCLIFQCSTCPTQNTCTNCFSGFKIASGICQYTNCMIGCSCLGYYLINGNCIPTCGDGYLRQSQQCDDGNLINGDGCSSQCKIQGSGWACTGQPSCCYVSLLQFYKQKIIKNPSSNQVSIYFSNGDDDLSKFTEEVLYHSISTNISFLIFTLKTVLVQGSFIVAKFYYTQNLQNQTVFITFSPALRTTCVISNTVNLTFSLLPDNNVPIILFTDKEYESQKSANSALTAIVVLSYLALGISMIVGKIVGLQLFGVLQLSFFTLAQQNQVNLLLSPILQMRYLNGLNPLFGKNEYSIPQRVSALNYDSSFINNFNIMLLVIVLTLITGGVLLIASYFIKKYSKKLGSYGKHIIKQVFLTLMLFNALNIGFSLGLQFSYSNSTQPSFEFSVFAIIVVIGCIIFLYYLLGFTSKDQFGQFKQKFKPQMVNRIYFQITILYRISLGMYIASMNQYDISTLVIISFSILFILYNLINLPFKNAYQNYRANLCHVTQFCILFITLYYTSMKKYDSLEEKARINSPAVIQISLLFICMFASIVCLSYEGYFFVKSKIEQHKKNKQLNDQKQSKNEAFKQTKQTLQDDISNSSKIKNKQTSRKSSSNLLNQCSHHSFQNINQTQEVIETNNFVNLQNLQTIVYEENQ